MPEVNKETSTAATAMLVKGETIHARERQQSVHVNQHRAAVRLTRCIQYGARIIDPNRCCFQQLQ